jgi:hypothetical protein
VLSDYLQKAVAEMSKKDREAGDIVTDFAKFSDAQRKKVAIVIYGVELHGPFQMWIR